MVNCHLRLFFTAISYEKISFLISSHPYMVSIKTDPCDLPLMSETDMKYIPDDIFTVGIEI